MTGSSAELLGQHDGALSHSLVMKMFVAAFSCLVMQLYAMELIRNADSACTSPFWRKAS